jgi:hypothetical protein
MGTEGAPRRLPVVAAAAIFLAVRSAAAEGTQPVPYVSRPLTLPKLVLVPEVSATVDRVSDATIAMLGLTTPKNLQVSGAVTVRFGILADIEVGAVVAPIDIVPSVAYGDPSIYGKFRFIRSTSFEMAGYIDTTFITHPSQNPDLYLPVLGSKAGVLFAPGLLCRIHASDVAKIDLGGIVPIQLGVGAHDVGLEVPVEVAFSIYEQLSLGARTGFGVVDFGAPKLENSYLPLGFFAGYTFAADRGPVLDLQGAFSWPRFVTPGAASKLDDADYQIGFSAALYLYLL